MTSLSAAALHTGASKRWLIGFGIWSILLSGAFFLDGMSADVSQLSGDQINILTVAAKKDHPQLFQRDLVVGNAADTAYYIPLFIDSIRLLSLPDHNYLRGLNLLLAITSLLYMWGWWLLFSLWGNKWTAAMLAFLVRGIMYPPGNELWGIAGLWTMLPRTLFTAALPWVLWLWIRDRRGTLSWGWPLVGLSCGALMNIHPISGACVAAALLLSDAVLQVREGAGFKDLLMRGFVGGSAMFVGGLPYIATFLTTIGPMESIDPLEFDRAIRMRISESFFDLSLYFKQWLSPKWILLVLGPWSVYAAVARSLPARDRQAALTLAIFSAICIGFAVLPAVVEDALTAYGHTPRFGFQLIRTGKYILVPCFIIVALLAARAAERFSRRGENLQPLAVGLTALCLATPIVSRHSAFDPVPFVGDDIIRQLLPPAVDPPTEPDVRGLMTVLDWIRANTSVDAAFVGPRLIRVGAMRPVIHDFAGAVMLVEGNPRAFVETARRERQLRDAQQHNPGEQARLFASWGADYWVTRTITPNVRVAFASSEWFVYDLQTINLAASASNR